VKLGLLIFLVVSLTAGWGFAMMFLADETWHYYRDWKQLEVSVDDAPFVGGEFFWGLVQGAVVGIWQACKISNEPLNQKRARP
jgi:hypothetical protein